MDEGETRLVAIVAEGEDIEVCRDCHVPLEVPKENTWPLKMLWCPGCDTYKLDQKTIHDH